MPKAAIQLGHKVRTLRNSLGMTQEQLAEGAEISLKHLGEIERGRGNPTLTTLAALSKALHVTLSELTSLDYDRQAENVILLQIFALVKNQNHNTQTQIFRVLKAMLDSK